MINADSSELLVRDGARSSETRRSCHGEGNAIVRKVTKLWPIFVRCRTKMFLDVLFFKFFALKHFIHAICNIGNRMACVSI